MIHNKLYNIPKIVLLRNDKILYRLINLLTSNDTDNNSFNEVFDGARDFYPNSYRVDEIELSLSQSDIVESGITSNNQHREFFGIDYDFSFIHEMYKQFFTRNGAYLYVKDEKVNEYMELIAKVSPFQIMGCGLSQKLLTNENSIDTILATVENYTPLGLRVDRQECYAENHLHLKGAGYLSFNLSKIITNPTPKEYYKKSFLKELPRINEFSYINNYQLSIGQLVDLLKFCKSCIYESILGKFDEDRAKERVITILSINSRTTAQNSYNIDVLSKLNKILPIIKDCIDMQILHEIITQYDKDKYSKAYFLENILFFYIYNTTKDLFIKRVIKIYIHAINISRSYMVMSQNLGLAHFSEYSGSTLRQAERRNANNTASSIINSGTSKLNAKIGTAKNSETIAKRVVEFSQAFEKQVGSLDYNFGLSSTKGRESGALLNNVLLPQFYHKRLAIKKETLAIDDFIRNVRYKNTNKYDISLKSRHIEAFKNRDKLERESVDISSLVVSIDAVGKETHTPPEVFAPHFRYLRNIPEDLKNNIFLGSHRFEHHDKLLMTIHAGEDFNHLVTGMRRVDETLKYFDLERRDRLGHLMSLGIKPKEWIDTTKDIVMYLGDYFDDLVWMVNKLKYINSQRLNFQYYINKCEDEIWKLFEEIYPNHNGKRLELIDLYDAWLYRRNCPIVYQQRERGEILFGEYERRVLDEKRVGKNVRQLYELYHTCKKTRYAYGKVHRVKKEYITDDILNIWEAIQDYQLNDIAHRGIVIETNPSSNVFISSLNNYANHPIFRFSPPKDSFLADGEIFNRFGLRDGIVSTTINSDDPSIFVTTIQNEYRLIKNIAKEYYECSDKEADEWIDNIREFSIKIFNESHKSNPLSME